MAIRALILDFDGLILDTESPLRHSWMEVFAQHDLVVSETQWASLLGASADVPEAYRLIEQHLGHPIDRPRLHEQRMSREMQLLACESVLPGVRELIHDAQTAGLGLAVASSSDRAWVEGLLAKHDLIESFDAIVCAEDVARTKPAPDLFLKALEHLHVRANEAIVFEDSEHGVRAAKEAGIFRVAVPNKVTECLPFADANLIVTTVAEYTLEQYTQFALAAQEPSV